MLHFPPLGHGTTTGICDCATTPSPQYAVGLVTDLVAYISTVYLRPWPGREGCLHCCRTSFPLIKIRPNFSPAATEPRLGLTPNQPLPFDPRSFWRAGGHLSRFDVTQRPGPPYNPEIAGIPAMLAPAFVAWLILMRSVLRTKCILRAQTL